MIRKYQYILVLLIAGVLCSGFVGCGGGTTAAVAQHAEEIHQPISFLCDYAAGLELARQQRKPTLIFFSIPENAGSQRMLETTFRDEEIRRLASRLICIHVDGSQETALCESLGIISFPTTILSNANGVEVRRLEGRLTAEQLAVQIHILLHVVASRPNGPGR